MHRMIAADPLRESRRRDTETSRTDDVFLWRNQVYGSPVNGTPGTDSTANGTEPQKQAPTAPIPMQPVFIRAEQAAKMLTFTRRQVYQLIADGEIESVKYGRRRLIPVQSLYDFRDRLLAQAK